jgi:hypothetical protein
MDQSNFLLKQIKSYQKWLAKGEVLNNFANLHAPKKDGKKQKTFRLNEMGLGEEWPGELRDSASRMPGVTCSCRYSTIHYVEAQ